MLFIKSLFGDLYDKHSWIRYEYTLDRGVVGLEALVLAKSPLPSQENGTLTMTKQKWK